MADAGRGNTVFFSLAEQPLVLRHYYRGGLIRHISQSHYIFSGMGRTRALREFDLLLQLYDLSLPAPRPYACCVKRRGMVYQASLITYRLAGTTLAQRLVADGCLAENDDSNARLWQQIGHVIARFHSAGVYHADLNAHNIMIDNDDQIYLLDFDRGSMKALPRNPVRHGWCLQNMRRLQRSLRKLASIGINVSVPTDRTDSTDSWQQGFKQCQAGWHEELASFK